MKGERYCQKCGKYLGNYMIDNYYKLLRQKYCPTCAAEVKSDQTAESLRKIRRQKREELELMREQNQLLKQENELLRKRIAELRGEKKSE